MRMAWSLAQGVTFSALGENLFSITVNCLVDWKRITEEGPWLFRDHGVLIENYDGFTKFDEVVLDKLAVWIQVVRSLTRKVGEVMSVMLNPRWGNGRIVRVRVKLDVNEPLMRIVAITKNKRKVYYSILYEKMLVFCYVCGHMGHTFLEHGNGKHDKESMAWGDWILAPRSGSQPQGSRQNTHVGKKPNPQGRAESGKASVKELQDDASSPLKAGDGNKHDGEKSCKRLTYDEPHTEPSSSKLPLLLEPAVVGTSPMETLGPNHCADGEEEDDVSSQDSKRSKTRCNTVMDVSHQISASFEKELDRTQ
ncbi:hypothetical protein D1007_12332 [Hordeum vulgare]|nr:hypothetical protein D1007_12332 [Hordeum vulgare]